MSSSSAESRFPLLFVLALAVGQTVGYGSIYYAFAVIAEPMRAELDWSKPDVNLAISIALGVTGLVAYQTGRMIDRIGGHLLMTAGSAAAVLLLLAWSQVTALWQLYAVWAAMGAVYAAVLYEAAFAVMARELRSDYRRGIITITLVAGFASTIFIPLTHVLTESLGWRQALQVLALIQVPLGVLLYHLALRGRRGALEHPAGDVPTVAPPGRMARVLRNPVFWLLSLSYCAFSFMFTALVFHILPLLVERGISMGAAVAAYSLVGPSQVAGRVVVFLFERKIGTRLAGVIATSLPVAAILALMYATPGSPLLYVFAICYGSGMGIKTIVQATAGPELLGREGYGELQGALNAQVYVVQALTPFAAAMLWSVSGGYRAVELAILIAALLAFAAFGSAILVRPRHNPAAKSAASA